MMKSKIVISFILLVFYSSYAFAQNSKTTYYNADGLLLNNAEGACFMRVITDPEPGSTLYPIAEYYMDKTPKLIGKLERPEFLTMQGEATSFYPSGQKKEVVSFKQGLRVGDDYIYYPNGKLYAHKKYIEANTRVFMNDFIVIECNDTTGKAITTNGEGYYIGYDDNCKFVLEEGTVKNGKKHGVWKGTDGKEDAITFIEEYNDGGLISGKSTDKNSVTYNYTTRAEMPQYTGGLEAFGSFLGANIKYPKNARKNKKQGIVLLTFVVLSDGTLDEIKVIRSPDEELSAEAVRVLRNTPAWIPGKMFGRNVRVSYTVPIKFALG